MVAVPGIDLVLQFVAPGEQRAILRREIVHQGREAAPEGARIDAGAGQRLIDHEIMQDTVDRQTVDGDGIGQG